MNIATHVHVATVEKNIMSPLIYIVKSTVIRVCNLHSTCSRSSSSSNVDAALSDISQLIANTVNV